MNVKFGDCILDPERREILRRGKPVALAPKAYQLIETLIRRRPGAVSKSEIHRDLWPDTFVSDANLTNLVAHVRAALGDDARSPRIIRTVQRFGYAFAAPVEEAPAAAEPGHPVLKLIWRDREIAL